MIIEQGKHVAVSYKLTGYEAPENPNEAPEIEDIEETHPGQPFEFIFGVGQLIPGFEKNIEGKQKSPIWCRKVHRYPSRTKMATSSPPQSRRLPLRK